MNKSLNKSPKNTNKWRKSIKLLKEFQRTETGGGDNFSRQEGLGWGGRDRGTEQGKTTRIGGHSWAEVETLWNL